MAALSTEAEAAVPRPGVSDEEAIARFQQLLRMRTISAEGPGNGAYAAAAGFLAGWAQELGLEVETVSPVENKPVVFATLPGRDPSLPAVLLNSHYDVVPVMLEHWTAADPFAAERVDGKIYGRGTQDMKCVCVQYLAALSRLLTPGTSESPFLRTLSLSFVPDEESGGVDGMGRFLQTELWARQRVGVAFDEGLANPENRFTVFYGERNPWWVLVKATGNTGHGSRFIENTAVSKIIDIANKALEFRRQQECLLGHTGGCSHARARKLGDVTSLNLTMLKAGVSSDGGTTFALNVVPNEAEAGFDIRIAPDVDPVEIQAMLDSWTEDDSISWSHAPGTAPLHRHYVTKTTREENPWWGVVEDTFASIGTPLEPEIFPAGTDSRFLRELNIPSFGFSPLKNTPVLLHDHNEYVSEQVFLEGIGVYVTLIEAVANTATLPCDAA